MTIRQETLHPSCPGVTAEATVQHLDENDNLLSTECEATEGAWLCISVNYQCTHFPLNSHTVKALIWHQT